jgi:hypothetical protein
MIKIKNRDIRITTQVSYIESMDRFNCLHTVTKVEDRFIPALLNLGEMMTDSELSEIIVHFEGMIKRRKKGHNISEFVKLRG